MQNGDICHAFSYTVCVRRKLHVVNLVTHAGKVKWINESTSKAIIMTMTNVAMAIDNITQLFPIYSSFHQKQILVVGVVKNDIPPVGDGLLHFELQHIYINPI
jgi:hypothetical protein